MGQVTALGENWVNPATGGSLFQILDAGGISVGGVPIFSASGLPLFSLEVSPEYASLQGYPLLTINPAGSVGLPNGGSNFGPQTTLGSNVPNVTGAPYSTSSGLQEYFNYLPTTSQDQANAYMGFLMPGALGVTTNILTINARNPVFLGSGKNSCSVKWNGGATLPVTSFGGPSGGWTGSGVNGAPAYSSAVFWYVPNSNNSGASGSPTFTEGTYFGHFAIDLAGQAWNYGWTVGNPGGNYPDMSAAAMLFEHVRFQGDNGITGFNTNITGPPTSSSHNLPLYNCDFVMSSVEDALVLHCAVGGAPMEWVVNDGSCKMIGGNIGNAGGAPSGTATYNSWLAPLYVTASSVNITDTVLCCVIAGTPGGTGGVSSSPAQLNIWGIGFNGSPNPNIQIVPAQMSAGHSIRISLDNLNVHINTGTLSGANVGYIGPYAPSSWTEYLTGLAFTMVTAEECQFNSDSSTLQTFFAPSATGWATLIDCSVPSNTHQTMPGFLGSGCFINGNLMDRSNVMWRFQNGAISQQGLISTPFGTAYTTWPISTSVNAVGPGVTSGSATPTSATTYTVAFVPQIFVSSGGTGVSITINDPSGNLIASGISTLSYPGAYLPVGYQIQITYSTAPTVQVFGA